MSKEKIISSIQKRQKETSVTNMHKLQQTSLQVFRNGRKDKCYSVYVFMQKETSVRHKYPETEEH